MWLSKGVGLVPPHVAFTSQAVAGTPGSQRLSSEKKMGDTKLLSLLTSGNPEP
jgi:hypothetical protein